MDENETNRTKLKRTNEMDDWTLNGRLDENKTNRTLNRRLDEIIQSDEIKMYGRYGGNKVVRRNKPDGRK